MMEIHALLRIIDQLELEDQQAIMRVIDSMLTKHKMQKLLTDSAVEA